MLADEIRSHEVPPGNPDTNGTTLMKNTTKRWAIIAGASVASLGLLIGGTAAAGAAVTGSLTSVTHPLRHHGADDPTTAPTAAPTPGPTHDAGDDNGKDAVDHDGAGHEANEHATPEPGDDDAPGTADHHGGRVGEDNDGVHHDRGHGGSADDHSGPGRGGSDDNRSGSGHGGHGSDD
jgi:hypothetical protein